MAIVEQEILLNFIAFLIQNMIRHNIKKSQKKKTYLRRFQIQGQLQISMLMKILKISQHIQNMIAKTTRVNNILRVLHIKNIFLKTEDFYFFGYPFLNRRLMMKGFLSCNGPCFYYCSAWSKLKLRIRTKGEH